MRNNLFQTSLFDKYTDGTPISYQLWNNYLIKNQKFQIEFDTRGVSQVYVNHVNKSHLEITKTAQSKLQPESGNDCVVMLTTVLTKPDWVTVPCDYKFSDLILCQEISNSTINEKGGTFHNKYTEDILRPEGHLFIESLCVMFMKHGTSTNLDSLIFYLYRDQKGTLINFDFQKYVNSTLVKYFSVIQHYFIQPLQFTLLLPSYRVFATYRAVQSSVYERLHWMQKLIKENITQQHGYLLFPSQLSKVNVPVSLFHCTDGSYIHERLVTARICSTREGNVLTCICSSTNVGGGQVQPAGGGSGPASGVRSSRGDQVQQAGGGGQVQPVGGGQVQLWGGSDPASRGGVRSSWWGGGIRSSWGGWSAKIGQQRVIAT